MKYRIAVAAMVLLFITFTPPALAASMLDATMSGAIDQYVTSQMLDGQIPGLSLAIVKEGETIYLKGYGFADGSRPVTPQTPFTICSVGKTFTALAIRQLAGEGLLRYSDPVQQYIPWFTLADPDAAASITIGHLIGHKSGLSTASGVEAYTYNAANTIEDVVSRLKNVMPNRMVGLTEEYSNLNFIILGLVIEKVSGMTYGEYIQKNIFDRLDMMHSHTCVDAAEKDGLAVGHAMFYGFMIPTRVPLPQAQVPAGFQMASAEDMAKFASLYLNNGYKSGESVFENNELPELKTPMPKYKRGEKRYGTYFMVNGSGPDGYRGYNGHVGASSNYTTVMILSPERRIAIVVLTNCNNGHVSPPISAQTIANGIGYLLDTGTAPETWKLNQSEKHTHFLTLTVIFILLGIRVYRLRLFRTNLKKSKAKRAVTLITYIVLDGLTPLFLLLAPPLLLNATWVYLLNTNPQLWFQVTLASLVLAMVFVIKNILLMKDWTSNASAPQEM